MCIQGQEHDAVPAHQLARAVQKLEALDQQVQWKCVMLAPLVHDKCSKAMPCQALIRQRRHRDVLDHSHLCKGNASLPTLRPKGDVVEQGLGKQDGLLADDGHLSVQPGVVQRRQRDAIQQHSSLLQHSHTQHTSAGVS